MKTLQKYLWIFLLIGVTYSQHRGDDLSFQGMNQEFQSGVKATALGNAFTAGHGELDALFYNPAGTASISQIQVSIAGNSYQNIWRENQAYRSNRQVTTMSLILDGLVIPNPENNGLWDHEAYKNDTTYVAFDPILGKDAYSEAAADWQKKRSKSVLENIAVVYPLQMFDRKWVISAAYYNAFPVNDFDRNATYLDPHPGSDLYNEIIPRVVGPSDSVRINWYDYARERFGDIYNFRFTLASPISEKIYAGINVNYSSGETEELQRLDKVGWFDLLQTANNFKFSYDTLNVLNQGKSTFSSFSVQGGVQIHFDQMSVGLLIDLPHTIQREWNIRTDVFSPDSATNFQSSGKDELELPFSYAIGVAFRPMDKFRLYLDYKRKNYNDASFSFAGMNTTERDWKTQHIYSIGLEYQPFEYVTLLAGYQNIPQTFVPDGAAVQTRGPQMQSYTFGTSITIPYGQVNVTYQFNELKYEDIYYTNTNFNYQSSSRISFGYIFRM